MESMFCLYFSGFGYTMITLHSKIDKRRAWYLGYLKGNNIRKAKTLKIDTKFIKFSPNRTRSNGSYIDSSRIHPGRGRKDVHHRRPRHRLQRKCKRGLRNHLLDNDDNIRMRVMAHSVITLIFTTNHRWYILFH